MLSLALLSLLLGAGVAEPAPLHLREFRPEKGARLMTDSSGVVALFEPHTRRLSAYRAGRRAYGCASGIQGVDAWPVAFSGRIEATAIAGSRVLVAAGDGRSTTLSVIDLAECRVIKTRDLREPELIRSAVGSATGWAIAIRKPTGPPRVMLLSPDLDLVQETSPFNGPNVSKNAGAANVLPVLAAGRLWILPKGRYGLVEWREGDGHWRAMAPPACLSVDGVDVTGPENLWWLQRMFDLADDATKPRIADLLQAARAGTGGYGFVGAVAATAAEPGRIAALVREDRGRNCRLDVWETKTSAVISSTRLRGVCPGFLALSNGSAWVLEADGLRGIPLMRAHDAQRTLCPDDGPSSPLGSH